MVTFRLDDVGGTIRAPFAAEDISTDHYSLSSRRTPRQQHGILPNLILVLAIIQQAPFLGDGNDCGFLLLLRFTHAYFNWLHDALNADWRHPGCLYAVRALRGCRLRLWYAC